MGNEWCYAAEVGGAVGPGAFTRWRGDLCCSHWGEGEPPWPISRDISIFVWLLGLLNSLRLANRWLVIFCKCNAEPNFSRFGT